MRKLSPLSPEEQEFAEAHISLVDEFLHRKRLPADEYYDIVIFGYLEAVQQQCRNPIESDRQNFPAFASICMKSAVLEDRKYKMREMRRGDPLSLDYLDARTGEDDFSLYDIIPDPVQDVARQVERRDLIDRVMSVGTKRELEAIRFVCRGYEPREMSRLMGITPDTGSTTLYHFRRKAKAVREEREVVRCPNYWRNREAIRAQQNAYNESHREQNRMRGRAYTEAHREEINARRRARYAAKKKENAQMRTPI